MTWTYSGDPSSSNKDAVRFLTGDTDNTQSITLQDEEINWSVTQGSSVYTTACQCCEALMGKAAQMIDKQVGSLKLSAGQKYQHFKSMRATLQMRQAMMAIPYAGGISLSDKEGVEENTDRTIPFANTNLHEYPGTSVQDTEEATEDGGVLNS